MPTFLPHSVLLTPSLLTTNILPRYPLFRRLGTLIQHRAFSLDMLCSGCTGLKPLEHIERPWSVWRTDASGGFQHAVIDNLSMEATCELCPQFLALLKVTGRGPLKLTCRRAMANSWSMIDFSITDMDSVRQWLLFHTRALPAFANIGGERHLQDTDTTFHLNPTDQVQSINFDTIRGWI